VDSAEDAPTKILKLPDLSEPPEPDREPDFTAAPVRRPIVAPPPSSGDSATFVTLPVRPRAAVEPEHEPTHEAPVVPTTEPGRGVLLEARALRRVVGKGTVILNDVSLVARPREFVAVVGGSGAGKSTLLGALSGQRRPTSGAVLLDGVPLYEQFQALRQRIGYVPQDDVIHRELTVERALGYAAELRLPPRGRRRNGMRAWTRCWQSSVCRRSVRPWSPASAAASASG
jgi:ABC-type multidrug transport system fused ATPase/permease subunit